jgi:aminoglycoside phosphotransferase (APT) family kinase protein
VTRPARSELPAWTPEREITLADARRLVCDGFPELTDAEVELFAQGWDNTAVRVLQPGSQGEQLIFRFPRRTVALAGVHRELAWLPQLAPLLPLPIPVPVYSGSWSPDGSDPWPFWGARMLAGAELAEASPDPEQRHELAGRLGAFLRALHHLPSGDLGIAPGTQLELDPMGRGHPARRAQRTTECLARLRDLGVNAPLAAAAELVTRAAGLAPPSRPGVICHGDLHVRHVLVSTPSAGVPDVTGVIDWGDLCLADPAVDLSIAFAAFNGGPRQAFFDAYGPIDADRELRARALAVALSGLLTEYALAQVSADGSASALLPEVRNGIGRALED